MHPWYLLAFLSATALVASNALEFVPASEFRQATDEDGQSVSMDENDQSESMDQHMDGDDEENDQSVTMDESDKDRTGNYGEIKCFTSK